MLESQDQRKRRTSTQLIGRCVTSFVSASLTQLALYMVPRFFPSSSLITLLSLSAIVLLVVAGVGKCCKRILRVRASVPAFVFFSIIFVWGVYIGVVRRVISPIMDIILNLELLMLVIGLCRILSTDPGYVKSESSHFNQHVESPNPELVPSTCDVPYEIGAEENPFPPQRIRHCRHCKAYVKGFDHHCPAFGNCIGQKNHVLFMILVFGFVVTEASYIACSSQFSRKTQLLDRTGWQASLATSTMLFSLLQVLWQGVFLAWHIHCVCYNIRTDEWINWKKYPEFHLLVQTQPGQTPGESDLRFMNPYDKGILQNVKEFLWVKQ